MSWVSNPACVCLAVPMSIRFSRGRMSGGRLAVALLTLLLVWPAAAKPKPVPAASGRAPELRQLAPKKDAAALKRLEFIRARLPAEYRKRNNFAWAVAKIDGLDKTEYFAHSGIKRQKDVESAPPEDIEDISLQRKNGRFEVLCVNHDDVVDGPGCFPRFADTEYKIIEDIASRLPDPSVTGRVRIYTDLYPCASCRHVMMQFLTAYTNVRMQVLYRDRE